MLVGMNVIFDEEQMRLGFAKSACKYEDFSQKNVSPPSENIKKPDNETDVICPNLVPTDKCSATCKEPSGRQICIFMFLCRCVHVCIYMSLLS